MRFHAALVPLGATLALVPIPAAASPQARLVYGRSEEAKACPDETALRRAVAARVGYDPFFASAPRTVIVSIAARGDHLAARIELIDDSTHEQGTRDLESSGSDCSSLFDSVALTISIAIDPQTLSQPGASPAGSLDSAASPPAPVPPMSPPPSLLDAVLGDERHAVEPGGRPGVRIGADVRSSLGFTPSADLGFAVFVGPSWRHASVAAEVAVDLPASKAVSSSERVTAWILAASLVPCFRIDPLRVCGLATVGRLQGYASGVASPSSRDAPLVAFGGRLGLEVPVAGAITLLAHVDLLANADRTTLQVGSTDEWIAPPLAGLLALGVADSF